MCTITSKVCTLIIHTILLISNCEHQSNSNNTQSYIIIIQNHAIIIVPKGERISYSQITTCIKNAYPLLIPSCNKVLDSVKYIIICF